MEENERGWLTLCIADNGCGMTEETLRRVRDPFYTTRKTRKVGMGISLLQLAAEQTGGSLTIESVHESINPADHGTTLTATFDTRSIDFPPLGDIVEPYVSPFRVIPKLTIASPMSPPLTSFSWTPQSCARCWAMFPWVNSPSSNGSANICASNTRIQQKTKQIHNRRFVHTMKSLAELAAIKERMKDKVAIREGSGS